MSRIIPISLAVTTDGSGDGSKTDGMNIHGGKLFAVQWIVGTFSAGVDAVLSTVNSDGAGTLLTLTDANANARFYPRVLEHSEAGAALTGTTGGDRCMPLVDGALKLVVAAGGDTHTGRMVVYVKVE